LYVHFKIVIFYIVVLTLKWVGISIESYEVWSALDNILNFKFDNTLIHFDVKNYRVKLILLDIKMESKK